MNATKEVRSYVLDTSAVLAFWNDEEGADEVEEILRGAPDRTEVYFSFMTLMEGKYRLWRLGGKELAQEFHRMVDNLPISKVDLTDSMLDLAAEVKATERVSVADSWIIATALQMGATLVHKDPEFEQVNDRLSLFPLPYKKKKSRRSDS
jgi:predicted nucleic acid-binding protein